jgi:hypothetical protein
LPPPDAPVDGCAGLLAAARSAEPLPSVAFDSGAPGEKANIAAVTATPTINTMTEAIIHARWLASCGDAVFFMTL